MSEKYNGLTARISEVVSMYVRRWHFGNFLNLMKVMLHLFAHLP